MGLDCERGDRWKGAVFVVQVRFGQVDGQALGILVVYVGILSMYIN